MGTIFDIQRFCLDDGPGIRTVVFLKGCPLNCLWCHNPESQRPEIQRYTDNDEIIGRKTDITKVMETVLRDLDYYQQSGGGITLSGGEPLMQPSFCEELLLNAKAHGLHTCIETCGYAKRPAFERVLPHTDLFLYDIKAAPELHRKLTGQDNRLILENLEYLLQNGAAVHMRCPIIPQINDNETHFAYLASILKRFPSIQAVELMPYHNMGVGKSRRLGEKEPFYRDNPLPAQIDKWRDQLADMTGRQIL